jgi:hypothetical protein
MPDRFESRVDFSRGRFQAPDSSAQNFLVALSLFKDLLDMVPWLLFCIMDGLLLPNHLGESHHEDNYLYLLQLLDILRH